MVTFSVKSELLFKDFISRWTAECRMHQTTVFLEQTGSRHLCAFYRNSFQM